jgi:hypothetical protein
MTTQPSDWAVARAYWEVVMNGTDGLQGPYLIGRIELRARELDASGGGPSASVCLVTDRRLPHFAAAEIQLFNGYEPKIGDKLYATPRAADAGDLSALRELSAKWRGPFAWDGHDGEDWDRGARETLLNCADDLDAAMGAVGTTGPKRSE